MGLLAHWANGQEQATENQHIGSAKNRCRLDDGENTFDLGLPACQGHTQRVHHGSTGKQPGVNHGETNNKPPADMLYELGQNGDGSTNPNREEVTNMMEQNEFIDDPIGEMDLTDLDFQEVNGGTWSVTVPIATFMVCSKNTVCGSCGLWSTGCC
ncbi:hypothetical protein [Micromonospora luteifusca]|uniref:hypothetical protein n=1 Tax=Micromonospora luteifusca TaxID=709860 RepID=UPI0033BE305B